MSIDFTRLEQAAASRFAPGRASMADRWLEMVALAELGYQLEKSSPDPSGLKRVRDFNEMAWRQANLRLFRHAGL